MFIKSRELKRSHRHAVFFCAYGSDTKEHFKSYKAGVKRDMTKPCGLTMVGGSNVKR